MCVFTRMMFNIIATNVEGVAISAGMATTIASLCFCCALKIISQTHILLHVLQQHFIGSSSILLLSPFFSIHAL